MPVERLKLKLKLKTLVAGCDDHYYYASSNDTLSMGLSIYNIKAVIKFQLATCVVFVALRNTELHEIKIQAVNVSFVTLNRNPMHFYRFPQNFP